MSSTFFGLSIAQSGLNAQRRAMDILGYNIAHANDPTYKRQRLVLLEGAVLAQSQQSTALGISPFSGGVTAGDVVRVRDALVEKRLRITTQSASDWQYRAQTMRQIEAIFTEPGEGGLQGDLNRFWASWQKLASSPESLPIRSALLEDATALCQHIQFIYGQLRNTAEDLNNTVVDRVRVINNISQEIARLNVQISALNPNQVGTNELENRRDALVIELSKLIGINQHEGSDYGITISIGGRVLVQGGQANLLQCVSTEGGQYVVQWASDGQNVQINDGELNGILWLRDEAIPSYLSQLDVFASTLVEQVNAIHMTGKTLTGSDGQYFFKSGTTAANISLDSSIVDHPELIAASRTGAVGNNEVALAIAVLEDQPVRDGMTLNQLFRALVSDIGGSASISYRQANAHQLTLDQFTAQQQSVSGVSLDEEMTNMIKFQQAYNAAARLITVMDEMLGVLIMGTGMVGR
ncbi:MAG: flagellar hook-associated protein FlgK [Armatimonadota bacterium]